MCSTPAAAGPAMQRAAPLLAKCAKGWNLICDPESSDHELFETV